MLSKKLLPLLLAGLAVSAAHANTAPIGGKVGYEPPYTPGTKSVAEVQAELRAFQANPVSADGVRMVDGKVGYVSQAHSLKLISGKMVHTDNLTHNTPRPAWKMTEEERREFSKHYVN